jgi:hypothetical protein
MSDDHRIDLTGHSNQYDRFDRQNLENSNEPYVVHYIIFSFPTIFDNSKINYNWSGKKWNLTKLIAKCSQEEEMLRTKNNDFC